jgi:hypothetical protein
MPDKEDNDNGLSPAPSEVSIPSLENDGEDTASPSTPEEDTVPDSGPEVE